MYDLSELYQTVRTALVGDATLVAMLSSATAVFSDVSSDILLPAPCITLRMPSTKPRAEIDAQGKYSPYWRIKIFAQNIDRCRAIEARLGSLLDIPRTVPAGLAGATLRIECMWQVDSIEAGTWPTNDQGVSTVLDTVWNSSVRPVS